MYKKILSSLSVASILVASCATITDYNHASAQTQTTENQAQVKVVKLNDAQFKVVPNQEAQGKVENGVATITNKANGQTETLPKTVTTKNGAQAKVVYKIAEGNIVGDVITSEPAQDVTLRSTNWGKCILGTGGALIGGAGGGAATGAGYGAIGATPVSVGTGSIIGGVIGGISGGMTGAAASCF